MSEISFTLSQRGQSITLPINPEMLPIEIAGRNEVLEVVGLGEISIPRQHSLMSTTLESWFDDYAYENFILECWADKTPLNYTVSGLNRKAMQVLIQNYRAENRAGEETDTYFTLELIEYIPYGAQLIPIQAATNTATPTAQQRTDSKAAVGGSYTVLPGESWWSITQKLTGDGSQWKALYDANKALWANQGNVIHPNDILVVPSDWNSATGAVPGIGTGTNTNSLPRGGVTSGAQGAGRRTGTGTGAGRSTSNATAGMRSGTSGTASKTGGWGRSDDIGGGTTTGTQGAGRR